MALVHRRTYKTFSVEQTLNIFILPLTPELTQIHATEDSYLCAPERSNRVIILPWCAARGFV